MFFSKKNQKRVSCENCGRQTEKKYKFCPGCGNNLSDTKKEKDDFGFLGKDDFMSFEQFENSVPQKLTITDKLIGSVMNSMMKNLDKQFKEQFKNFEKESENTEIRTLPNGIKIKISGPFYIKQKRKVQQVQPRTINNEQTKKMSALPREKAKTSVKRFGDKIIYELSIPGVESPQDIFISKLESGYEVKAIGNKKIYVNSIPLNLPLRRYSIDNNKLSVEFFAHDN